jgi:hypothetical protein
MSSHPNLPVTDPRPTGDERTLLQEFLQAQRDLVAWKLADADFAALQRVATPTGLAPLGVLRHLTHVERWWFRHQTAGEPDLSWDWSDDDADGEYRLRPGETVASLLADYATEWRICDAAVAGRPLDAVGEHCPFSLRWVYLHMIEETSRHLGHIDLLREQADGSTGSDPLQVAGEVAARDDVLRREQQP